MTYVSLYYIYAPRVAAGNDYILTDEFVAGRWVFDSDEAACSLSEFNQNHSVTTYIFSSTRLT